MELGPLPPARLEEARSLLARACAFDRAAEVAEEKLFDPGAGDAPARPIGAVDDRGALVGVAVGSAGFLRLLAVDPPRRGAGVGSALLAEVERGATGGRLRAGCQPGNYLAPGVDERDTDTVGWLERRGFRPSGRHVDLLVDLHTPRQPRPIAPGYRLARLAPGEADAAADVVAAAFSPGWAFELRRAATEPSGVHVARAENGSLAAFAVHDGNNRGLGWFGPTGTLPAHRGRGLGAALLLACLDDLARAGHDRCEVAWIGPRDFYERVAGVAGERTFAVLDKDLP